jgi:light-regulated signal transduction histidine kinase (bacteriophytochrome)
MKKKRTGIGTSLLKNTVNNHKGSIKIDRKLGEEKRI